MTLFWLDVSALALSSILFISLALMVMSANPACLLNLYFSAFMLLEAACSFFSLLMKLALWLRIGAPLLMGEWAALCLVISTPVLLLFTTHYLGLKKRRILYVTALSGLVCISFLIIPLFQHKILLEPFLLPNGTTSVQLSFSVLSWGAALLPFIFLIGTIILFWLKRQRMNEYYLPLSVFVFGIGYLLGALLDVPLPTLSFTTLISCGILGYGVVRRQLFNPLREANAQLEKRVEARTEDLKQAYAEVEKRVNERTKELIDEIAKHKKTEEILRESEEKFRNLAEESPNMIFINKGGKIIYANRKCQESMGYTREEFYAPHFNFRSLISPEHVPLIESNLKHHLEGQEIKPYEYAIITKSGKKIETIITTRLIHYDSELAILGIITDISRQKRVENLLKNLNEAALTLVRCLTPNEVWSMVGKNFSQSNLCCCILERDESKSGFILRYLSQKSVMDSFNSDHYHTGIIERFKNEQGERLVFVPGAALPFLQDIVENKLPVFRQEKMPFLQEHTGILYTSASKLNTADHRNGEEEFLLHVIRQLCHMPNTLFIPLLEEQEAFGLLIIHSSELLADDIPAYTAYSHQLSAAWHKTNLLIELARSLNELRLAQEELLHSQKMEAIGRLAGGVAHDFNNILTVINSYTQLLYNSLKETEQREPVQPAEHEQHTTYITRALGDLEEIRNATYQAAQLTNQLLMLCRKKDIQPVILDINQIIDDMRKMLEHLLGEQIQLKVHLIAQEAWVKADPGQIEQILLNLIMNARDALPEGGEVIIRVELSELEKDQKSFQEYDPRLYVKLLVQDTGIGIDENTKKYIFEPFFTTKPVGKGTGLGLALVYSSVKQNYGHIYVASLPKHGTTFTIYFPYTNEELL